ncbi:MAG: hypothetical protein ACYC3F_16985 [Gemmatimonadaceae bacterium]
MPPFGPLPRVWYVVGALAACLVLSNGWLAYRQQHASERVVTLREQIRVTDTLYARDTVHLSETRRIYRTLRDTLTLTDTVEVKAGFAAADSALAACDSALRTSERRVALRDTLVREAVKAVAPKPLQFYGEALAGYHWQAPELRAGATLRVTGRVQVVGELAHRLDGGRTIGRVGVRLTY